MTDSLGRRLARLVLAPTTRGPPPITVAGMGSSYIRTPCDTQASVTALFFQGLSYIHSIIFS